MRIGLRSKTFRYKKFRSLVYVSFDVKKHEANYVNEFLFTSFFEINV